MWCSGFSAHSAEGDAEIAVSLVGDELVYANVSLPTIRGKQRFTKAAALYFRHMGFDVRVHRIAANGTVVLTERTTRSIIGPHSPGDLGGAERSRLSTDR